MTLQLSTIAPKVFVHDGKAVTTSQAVAEYFHKLHKNVIQKIETLDCSPEFMTANFSAIVVTVQAGFNERETKAYEMTKDGFVFLVMGFTGKKAAAFKEAYIAEFNRMENSLHGNPHGNNISPEEIDAYNVQALAKHFQYMYEAWKYQIEPALRKIESPLAGRLHDRFTDGAVFLTYIEKSLKARLKPGQTPRIH